MVKAKKFQPLAVLNQKLKGLDVFESNTNPTPPSQSSHTSSHTPTPDPVIPPDPEEFITKSHWQRPGYDDSCSEPSCEKRLGNMNGRVNCRKCGLLYCEEHTMFQIRLSRSAQHEPVRGVWCRCCETCYVSREGYNDHHGLERDHTDVFRRIRQRNINRSTLETSRLEKRLTKLTQLLANPPSPEHLTPANNRWSLGSLAALTNAKAQQKRALEQSIIEWQDDSTVSRCPYCQQEFTNYTFRRHHCRLCGKVVCGDAQTACSSEIGLNIHASNAASEKPGVPVGVDVRMCQDCKHTLFSRSDYARDLTKKPADQRAFENLQQFERGIRLLLPRFQKLLLMLQDNSKQPTLDQLQEAAKVRKRLTLAFTQYDTAAKRIRDLPSNSSTQQRLQRAVYQQAYNFLSLHMLSLKSLPKLLKNNHTQSIDNRSLNRPPNGALAAIMFNETESSSVISGSSVSAMEAEEKDLRERLIVLEEQKFFVQEMLADVKKHRRFDEAAALGQNIEDLNREIAQITSQISSMDFASAYQGGIASPPG
ncbi:FYVE-domain-containing protein [Pseudovirgaria hyperparasitica]|uniref:FYVE-domain-containing protein n=1 Tax=Pseudovirgaria hyperparasitica TaxID=470096 RepID=A0A6A6WHD2_9PEZI|nr:FYVE-domain-containing protein [Pseudovirgaria hyperparasitica]KAF2762213.1 FYVE-domain-containing protein [Pseudovirgaria hyperparasitica]